MYTALSFPSYTFGKEKILKLLFVEQTPVRMLSRPLQILTFANLKSTKIYPLYSYNMHFLFPPLMLLYNNLIQ